MIKVNLANINQAEGDLNNLINLLKTKENSMFTMVENTSGLAYREIVNGMNELNKINKALQEVIVYTKNTVSNAGETFKEIDEKLSLDVRKS